MADDTEPTFRVEVSSRPILVHICARANFLNCSPLRTFFRNMVAKGNHEFSLDFAQCEGMDSTFLGILAGLAIDTQRSEPQGSVTLTGLGERNLELVKNLGLHRIVNIVENSSDQTEKISDGAEGLSCEAQTEEEKKEMLIGAHEDLVKIDETNLAKFQDLLTFLKNEE
ncbi:STAS domain-containing protein [Opitutia bacterium ISCC 51]|nr:STAS domain-containing protein [Opitutae bacterium ISCC 51]QXD26948.1 STAS domain-containing protein [Opitutae bacterium ISCC 52]